MGVTPAETDQLRDRRNIPPAGVASMAVALLTSVAELRTMHPALASLKRRPSKQKYHCISTLAH